MAATEFVVSDVRYAADVLPGLTQFHVVRRLSPLLSVLPIITRGRKPGDVATPVAPEQVTEALQKALAVIGEMKDDDVNYVLDACMSKVSRWDASTQSWYNVWNSVSKKAMYEDVNMIVMTLICFHVLKASVGPFTLGKNFTLAA